MEILKLKFENELCDKSLTSKKECKYNPTYFNQMLSELGGFETAKKLLAKGMKSGNPSDGYTTLLLCGRLDLTMEATVIDERFSILFEQEEIDYCLKLLGK